MKKFKIFLKELKFSDFDPNKDLIVYHGSSKKIEQFKPGIIFLTLSEEDAIGFAKGFHKFKPAAGYLHEIAMKYI